MVSCSVPVNQSGVIEDFEGIDLCDPMAYIRLNSIFFVPLGVKIARKNQILREEIQNYFMENM